MMLDSLSNPACVCRTRERPRTLCRNTRAIGINCKSLSLFVLCGFDLNVVQWPNATSWWSINSIVTTLHSDQSVFFSFQMCDSSSHFLQERRLDGRGESSYTKATPGPPPAATTIWILSRLIRDPCSAHLVAPSVV